MATPNTQPAETPAEGAQAASEDTEAVEGAVASEEDTGTEGEDAAEGAAEETEAEGEAPADGEKIEAEEKPSEVPKALKDLSVDELSTQLTEDQLQRVAQKYSNRTMAAARKAERAVEEVRGQNQRLTNEVTVYKGFVDQLQANPMAALRRVPGWSMLTFKQFAEIVAKDPSAVEPAKVDPEVAALRRRLDEREAADRQRASDAQVENSKRAVQAALEKEPDRFDLVLNDIGQAHLWDAIRAYHSQYGSVPNAKVFEMADVIERRMSKSRKSPPSSGAKASTPTAGNGQAAGSRTAKVKTITNRASSGAPAIPDYSNLSEAERDRRILADMRAAGEI